MPEEVFNKTVEVIRKAIGQPEKKKKIFSLDQNFKIGVYCMGGSGKINQMKQEISSCCLKLKERR